MKKVINIEKIFEDAVISGEKLTEEEKDFFFKEGYFDHFVKLTGEERFALRWMYNNYKNDLYDCWFN